MKKNRALRLVVFVGMMAFLMVVFTGCSTLGIQGMSGGDTAASDSTDPGPKSRKTTAVYYDFEDVLIPMELSIVKEKTVVVSTPGFTSGIIALKGRVERRSLFNFFNHNMQKDNWNVITQIKSPGATIMVFQKTTRTAVITIRDEQFNTFVEVGVAPTVTAETGFSHTPLME